MNISVEQLQIVTKAKVIQGTLPLTVTGVTINSRTVKKGDIFIAVRGERFDGHDFIRQVIAKGVRAVIVSKKVSCPPRIIVLQVQDTVKALGLLAAWYRRQCAIPVFAITGSAGKTTAKEMIAAVLSKRYKVLKNVKTENNHIGVPLTILKCKPKHEVMVLECGTNQPGDIQWLAEITRPDTVVFTNIGSSHLQRLRSPAGVFKEKVQLIKHLNRTNRVILNGDDPILGTLKSSAIKPRLIRYGTGNKSNVTAQHISLVSNRQIKFKVGRNWFTLNSPAQHNVYNALAAISCGLLYKIRYNDIASAVGRFKFRHSRQEIIKVGRNWIIDDTYNANPLSLASAVSTLANMNIRGKRIVVCADMLELGKRSIDLHKSAGRLMAQSGVPVVLTFGSKARYITLMIKRMQQGCFARHCTSKKDIHKQLEKVCAPGDAVLVKGSRGMHMEETVAFLKKHLN